MSRAKSWCPPLAGLLVGTLLSWCWLGGQAAPPSFTEEREAAVQFFIRKHLPELQPVLDELQKSNRKRYEREIGTLFQTTEYLAALRDQPARQSLELKIWQAEQRANLVLAQLALAGAGDRKALEAQLQDLAKELVALDTQVLTLRAEQLNKELTEVKSHLTRSEQNADQLTNERFQALLNKVKKSGN